MTVSTVPECHRMILLMKSLLWLSYFAFIAVHAIGFYYTYQPQSWTPWLFPLVQLLPFLSAGPWLLKGERRAFLIFGLVCLVYLVIILSGVSTPWPAKLFYLIKTVLFVMLFSVSMALVKLTPILGTKLIAAPSRPG